MATATLPNAGDGTAMLRTLQNNGVKPDELKWLGLDDLENKGKVTKQDILETIRENQIQLKEVRKDQTKYRRLQVLDGAGGLVENRDSVKFADYTLPGKKQGYTELLLTLPDKDDLGTLRAELEDAETARTHYLQTLRPVPGDVELRFHDAQTAVRKAENKSEAFRSSHFEEPNILAHVRFDERRDADGKKVLFLEA